MMTLQGIPASPGIRVGTIFRPRLGPSVPEGEGHGGPIDPVTEWDRYRTAADRAAQELDYLHQRTREELGDLKAEIFASHRTIAQDPELEELVRTRIHQDGLEASTALEEAERFFVAALEALEDELFRSRVNDVKDVCRRIAGHLGAPGLDPWEGMGAGAVVLAEDLSPSDTAGLDRAKVVAMLTLEGSRTSHSSILARALGLPAVVGLGSAAASLASGSPVIVDGDSGRVVVDPAPGVLEEGQVKEKAWQEALARDRHFATRPTVTACGAHRELGANIGGLGDLEGALQAGAEAIGLFRTEFMYLDRRDLPTEEEQYQVYRQVLEAMAPRPVVIRTLDIGGDKALPQLPLPPEANPFLGVRALRLCLARPGLFRSQLRALLRASGAGKLRIMFPMVATVDEFRQAKALLLEEKAALEAQGVAVADNIETGMMVEIPSAVLLADHLAREADFFSIGTNDLMQYTMAADRLNPGVAYLYQPLNPAILWMIKRVCDAAHAQGRWVGVCGEMGGDPKALPFLLGLGVDEISMTPRLLPSIRARLADLHADAAEALATQALGRATSAEVEDLLLTFSHHQRNEP